MTSDDDCTTNPLRLRCVDVVEVVTDYLDSALDQHDLETFEAHLAGSDGCSVFVDQMKMTITLTRATHDDDVQLMPNDFDALVTMLRERAE